MSLKLDVFVPNGDSRHETAVLLVGTAEEYNIEQRHIRAATNGFFISEELATIVYDGADEEDAEEVSGNPETEPEASTTSTSGNRAAKKSTSQKKE